MCLHTHAYLGPSKSNETARPKGRQTYPRAAASTCKYRQHMFVNSQQNALVRCDCHINIFKKTNLLSVNTIFNFFINCLFCCFSFKRIMCKTTSELVTAFLFALFHRNCKVALWCWIMPNHSLFLTSRVYVVL